MEALEKDIRKLSFYFTEQNEGIDKLKVVTNYLSFEVYDYVDECETYDDAGACTEALFV